VCADSIVRDVTDVPEIQYAKSGDVHIAYQVVGEGPIDLVYSPGICSNLEIMWEWPDWSRYLTRLSNFTRLILFDMRGVVSLIAARSHQLWNFRPMMSEQSCRPRVPKAPCSSAVRVAAR
jgi:hypothetical protein